MAIFNNDNGIFKEVDKVHLNMYGAVKNIQRVWVHNGTKYIMVKGRLLEVIWEKDISTYGGMSLDNDEKNSYNNIIYTPQILDNGDLMGVINYVVNNNSSNQYSTNRYALIKLSSENGDISAFSTYTNWISWKAVSGYKNTAQPIGVTKLGDTNYFVAYSDIGGILYLFNSSGAHKSTYENETWHTDQTAKFISYHKGWGCKVDYEKTGKCLYYQFYDQNPENKDSSSFTISVYRAGIDGTAIYAPRRHFDGEREYRYYSFGCSVFIDNESRTGIASYYPDGSYSAKLVTFLANRSSSATTTSVGVLTTLTTDETEVPLASKDGYVYTRVGNVRNPKVRKRAISDLSLVWEISIPELTYGDCAYIHQHLPEASDGFLLPNGCIIHPDGTLTEGNKIWGDNSNNYTYELQSHCYDKDKNIGYLMDDNYGTFCKVIKFKEVVK